MSIAMRGGALVVWCRPELFTAHNEVAEWNLTVEQRRLAVEENNSVAMLYQAGSQPVEKQMWIAQYVTLAADKTGPVFESLAV